MIINEQVSKAWNAFLQARANVLHSARDFLPLGLIYIYIYLVFYHVIRQSAVIKRALIGYDVEILLSNVHSRVKALRCEKRVFCVL